MLLLPADCTYAGFVRAAMTGLVDVTLNNIIFHPNLVSLQTTQACSKRSAARHKEAIYALPRAPILYHLSDDRNCHKGLTLSCMQARRTWTDVPILQPS